MVYAPDAGRSRSFFARSFKVGLLPDTAGEPDFSQPRDLKKLILIIGLGTLSWVATYVGMLELIQANMGDLPLTHKVIVGFSVAMLMTMIIWLLDQMFSPIGALTRLAYFAGYLFLSIISVGFGFGFYWKVLESRGESSRSAEFAVTGVQTSLNAASTRLEQLNATLLQLASVSRAKAETERIKGTSCPNSKPGDGPRRRMRDEDASRFSFASDFVQGRVTAVKADMAALDGDLAKIAGSDPSIIDAKSGTRNEFMKGLGRKLDMTVSSFNALRTDPQLKQLRQDLSDRADQTRFGDPKSGGFVCPDAELAQALRGAVRAIGELPVLETPKIAAVEGSEATIEAFRRLTATFYGLLAFDLPPSAEELRELQKKAIQSVESGHAAAVSADGGGLSKRDYVPLAVAIFVDICLLLVSIGRPAHGLNGLVPKMREAERGPVIEILSRFNEIHRDPEIRESFELFRHVVFDIHGAYYVAVPLDAPLHASPERREELRIEAQLLANLFTSFEKDRIFSRTWTPFAGAVRKKLAKQGSKFANAEAFRVYKFRDGAWSEMILGAVMGAARRAEAEAHRRRLQRDLLHPAEPSLGPVEPVMRPRREPSGAQGASVAREAPTPDHVGRPPDTRPSEAWARARGFHAKGGVAPSDVFGPYARSAEAELRAGSSDLGLSDDVETAGGIAPANSNTAPAQASESPPAGEPRVDVVLKRETATVSLPLNAAQEHDALIGRLGQAFSRQVSGAIGERSDKNSADRLVTAAAQNSAADASSADDVVVEASIIEPVIAESSTDLVDADAAAMAARFRRAREGT